MTQSNGNNTGSLKEAKLKRWGWMPKLSAAALVLLVFLLLALAPPVRRRLEAHLTSSRRQAFAARLARVVLKGRYRFYDVDPAMVWNNGEQIEPGHRNVDFLSKIVLRTNSPLLLVFARFDSFGPDRPAQFDISIDGGASMRVVWHSVLAPQRLVLGEAGEHRIVIRANPLIFGQVGTPYPLKQNVITGFAVPANYRISLEPEPARRHILVTVTDSIGQGYGTPDPAHDAWTAQLDDSGRWPGAVMNRGFVGARLADFCNSAASCAAFADRLDLDYPNASAYYFALGTNDFILKDHCVSPSLFADNFSRLLEGLHARNPQATLYLQTPLRCIDEAQRNSCGNTLVQFRDAELRVAQTLSWVRPIDGFAKPFPQIASGGSAFSGGLHPTEQGQKQYFHAVMQSLHLGN